MRAPILILYLLFNFLVLISQEREISIGFSGGTTFSSVKAVHYFPGNYSYRLGFEGEFSFKMNIRPHLIILSDISILQKGYNFSNESPLSILSSEIHNSYSGIELGVSNCYLNNGWFIGFQFGNKIEVLLSAGAYYSFYLYSKTEDWNYIYVDPIDHEIIGDPAIPVGYHENRFTTKQRNQNISNWDVGISGSIGLGYRLNQKYTIRLRGKYNHGLIDTSISDVLDTAELYNRSFSILVGLELKL